MVLRDRLMEERTAGPVEAGPLVDRMVELRHALLRMAQENAELRAANSLLRAQNTALSGRFRRGSQD